MPVIRWHEQTPMPGGVAGGAAAAFAREIVYAGGTTWDSGRKRYLTSVHCYQRDRKVWRLGPALPERMAYGPSFQQGTRLEILGGENENGTSRHCWALRDEAKQWTSCGDLPADSILGSAAVVKDQVYLLGGCRSSADLSSCSDRVYRRGKEGRWEAITRIPGGPLAMAAIVALEGKIYLFGGCTLVLGQIENQRKAYRYEPDRDKWTELPNLPIMVRGISAIALDKTRILLAGGYSASAGKAAPHETNLGFSDKAWIFDVSGDSFSETSRVPLAVAGMALLAERNTIWGLGGEDRMKSRSARFFEGSY